MEIGLQNPAACTYRKGAKIRTHSKLGNHSLITLLNYLFHVTFIILITTCSDGGSGCDNMNYLKPCQCAEKCMEINNCVPT
jgi:hypothetical protein